MPTPIPTGDRPLVGHGDRSAATPPDAARAVRRVRPSGPFVRHGIEMLAAMMLGMGLLYAPLRASIPGFSSYAALDALAMATLMAVPMVAWMRHRRHPAAHIIEMVAAMAIPAFALTTLYWADVVGGDTVRPAQHGLMIPAMLAVMLWRREDYSRDAATSDGRRR